MVFQKCQLCPERSAAPARRIDARLQTALIGFQAAYQFPKQRRPVVVCVKQIKRRRFVLLLHLAAGFELPDLRTERFQFILLALDFLLR
jgi:hypothetical protein